MKRGKAGRPKQQRQPSGKAAHTTAAATAPPPAATGRGRKILVFAVAGVVAAGAAIVAAQLADPGDAGASPGRQIVQAQLSPQGTEGRRAYDKVCAACHGFHGAGTSKGPPLIHDIYNPGHHDDTAFVRAARVGVRQHHWRFGDMPAQPQVSADQLTAIVRYVREMQVANGIIARPHSM